MGDIGPQSRPLLSQHHKMVLDKHTPLKTCTIVARLRGFHGYNDEIRKAKRERRRAEKRWRWSNLISDLVAFKIKRNVVNNLMNKARCEFYTNFIDENGDNQRKLFRASKRLFDHSHSDSLPPICTLPLSKFANDLGKYFVKKTETLQRKLNTNATLAAPPASTTATSATERVPLLTAFKILSVSDVQLLVQQSVLKFCQLDPERSQLVSECDALLLIVNMSLQTWARLLEGENYV